MVKVVRVESQSLGYLQLNTLTLQDSEQREFSRQVISRGNSACVLCYDLVAGKVLLVEQFRPGASPTPGMVLECIAGIVESNETPVQSLCREAMEEAGVQLKEEECELVGQFMLSPGVLQETSSVYLAHVCLSRVDTQRLYGLKSEHEEIRPVLMSFHHFRLYMSRPLPRSATLQIAGMALLKRLNMAGM